MYTLVDIPGLVQPPATVSANQHARVVPGRSGAAFPLYLAAMRRPDLGHDPRFLTPELRLRNLPALHRIVQDWITTFGDMAALDAQMDEAKIATGQDRSAHRGRDDWHDHRLARALQVGE